MFDHRVCTVVVVELEDMDLDGEDIKGNRNIEMGKWSAIR